MHPPPPPLAGSGSPPANRATLAVAALVFAILGLLGSVVLVGALAALVGLVLGLTHLKRGRGARMMGWSAVWVSVMALVASLGFGGLYWYLARQARVQMAQLDPGLRSGPGFEPGVVRDTGLSALQNLPAPDFEVTVLDGSKLRLSDLRGRPVLLVFWATWCVECLREMPHLVRLQRELGTNAVAVLGLSSEDRAVLKPFAVANGLNYPVASVAEVTLPDPYQGVDALPLTLLIDRDGVLRRIDPGAQEFEELQRRVAEFGGGRPAGARPNL